jgi:hypothetical protein
MTDVVNKRCAHEGCDAIPSYGREWRKPIMCRAHADMGMTDVKNKRCAHEGCCAQPVYGREWHKPLMCRAHADADMVDVMHKRCAYEGCDANPNYGHEWRKPLCCRAHADADMVDVKHMHCSHEDCDTRPWYGHPGHPVTCCAVHRSEGMLRYSNRRCRIAGCTDIAVFGTVRQQLHCEAHAVAGEINIVERACAGCGLLNIVSPTSRQCGYCDPTFKAKRPVKWKELDLKACLQAAGHAFAHDRAVASDCNLRDRPDFVMDVGHGLIVVENDEHQHRDRMCAVACTCPVGQVHCQCQQARMVDLGQAMGLPQVWLRYNPDAYKEASGAPGKVGVARRKQHLLALIKRLSEREAPLGYTSCIYVFYDGNDQTEKLLIPFQSNV